MFARKQGTLLGVVGAFGMLTVTLFAVACLPIKALALPSSFDLRSADLGDGVARNYVTSVKNQGSWGTCWAFGSTSAVETSVLAATRTDASLDDGSDSIDLSELQLAWFAYSTVDKAHDPAQAGEGNGVTDDEPLNAGGHPYTAAKVFATGTGPALESVNSHFYYRGYTGAVDKDENDEPFRYSIDEPWCVPSLLRFTQSYVVDNVVTVEQVLEQNEDTGAIELNTDAINAVKSQLHKGHGVAVSYASEKAMPDDALNRTYMNTETWAQYTDANADADHVVAIVGWDDKYSRTNFNKGHRPKGNGAWIVKNSWGAEGAGFPNEGSYGIDGSGYFYLSYYDVTACDFTAYRVDVSSGSSVESGAEVVEQHDYMTSDFNKSEVRKKTQVMANVFTAAQDETINAISLVTPAKNVDANYKIYRLSQEATDPTDGTLLEEGSASFDLAGYHRLKLNGSYGFEQGERFSLVVDMKNEYGRYVYNWNMEVSEKNAMGLREFNLGEISYGIAVVNPGESLLYSEKTGWRDLTDIIEEVNNTPDSEAGDINGMYAYDNFPLKAYGTFGLQDSYSIDGGKAKAYGTQEATGYTIEPDVRVWTAQGKHIPTSLCAVSFSSNKKPGEAACTVVGKGGLCTGTVTTTFNIRPAQVSYAFCKSKAGRVLLTRWYDSHANKGAGVTYTVKLYSGKALVKTLKATTKVSKVQCKVPKLYEGKKITAKVYVNTTVADGTVLASKAYVTDSVKVRG